MSLFISGEIETPTTADTSEEHNTKILSSLQGPKVHAFEQDDLDAHEEFSESQPKQASSEYEIRGEDVTKQMGQKLQKEQFEKEDEDQLEIKSVRDENTVVYPEHLAQEHVGTEGQMLDTEEDYKQQNQLKKNEVEGQCPENKNPPLEANEVVSKHGPGPLVTELDDEEQLETIHLPPRRSLRTDDLPDLEDVDLEEFTEMFSQQAFKPKIEIISGGCDEEEPNENHSKGISTFSPDEKSMFLMRVCKKSTGVSDNSSSLVYSEDEDAVLHHPESTTNQSSSPPRCLIEELE